MTDTIESLYRSSPRQIRSHVVDCISAGLVPFIQSSPGMGKSSIMRSISKEHGLELIDERLSTRSPVDLAGFPHFENDVAKFVPFDVYPTIDTKLPKGKDGWMLFFDEFNSAQKSVQAAAYKIVLDKMIGQKKLHERVVITAAGNLSTDRAIVNSLSTAMQSRIVHLEMEINHREWMEDVAIPENYDPRVIAYLSYQPHQLMDFRPDHNEKTFCCPRTWEFMNKLIHKKQVTDAKTAMYAGTITSGVAVDFVQFVKVFDNLVTIQEVLRDPKNARLPQDPPTRWAVISHLLAAVDEKNFDGLCDYIERFSTEFKVLFFRSVMIRQPKLRSHPAFIKTAVNLMRYLHGD